MTALQETFQTTPILIGGKVCKINPELLFSRTSADLLVDGEAEDSIADILAIACGAEKNKTLIPGLIYREQGRILRNPEGITADINAYRVPYHRFSMERYVRMAQYRP
ncbi:MAG: hypothetical protein HQL07_04735 [Nitrospirae bacterium]|nr:hypothetical protein [Magnetococcales bacterium]HAT50169.1 hypothetical protein [Alphaproteobacteria bacterium]